MNDMIRDAQRSSDLRSLWKSVAGAVLFVCVLLFIPVYLILCFLPVQNISRYSAAIDALGPLAHHFPQIAPDGSRMYLQRGFAQGSTWLYLHAHLAESEFADVLLGISPTAYDTAEDGQEDDLTQIPKFRTGDKERPMFPTDFSNYTVHILGGKDSNAGSTRYGLALESNTLSVVHWAIYAPW